MAQKIQVILEDDLDGSPADETVRFAFEEVEYEIDLSTAHSKEFRDSLAPFVSAARRIHPRGRRTAAVKTGPSTGEIRAWAKEQNIDVNPFGRLARSVIDAYTAAH
ncbi:Lsr2 family protein [Arthrobacter sp. zg-Y1110]|uniref:histone-like nucleoid-structuring protein Lsr2 n=1 Tax=Arthrobacter sp. zg-Y1110 TaxID=2886932 RepID=UPI001D13FCBB|nr:Lsr2 family protein [Arthrobacter sp. zg-Y1110]MCC3292479.1 Lsr2 family protein [Arthrobacter sp. zg-Y1110]UWX87088.1 Lsr2 family protein [Arthrobacter sp. zg-Y1110]